MTYLFIALLTFSIPTQAIEEIAWVESRNKPNVVSPAGAIGVMQVMPHTARDPGFDIEPLHDPTDPTESKKFARRYFRALVLHFGSVSDALRSYNWGLASVNQWIEAGRPPSWVPAETKEYVRRLEDPVLRAMKSSLRSQVLSTEASVSRTIAKRDGTYIGYYSVSYAYDAINAERLWILYQSLSTKGDLNKNEKRLFKQGINLTMPHGIKLSIDRDRVMDAPVPNGDRPRTENRDAPTPSSDMSPMELGRREAKESMRDGDFDPNISTNDDMVVGIVENAGLPPTSENLQAFVQGWRSASDGSQERQESSGQRGQVLGEAEATPMSPNNSVFV